MNGLSGPRDLETKKVKSHYDTVTEHPGGDVTATSSWPGREEWAQSVRRNSSSLVGPAVFNV